MICFGVLYTLPKLLARIGGCCFIVRILRARRTLDPPGANSFPAAVSHAVA